MRYIKYMKEMESPTITFGSGKYSDLSDREIIKMNIDFLEKINEFSYLLRDVGLGVRTGWLTDARYDLTINLHISTAGEENLYNYMREPGGDEIAYDRIRENTDVVLEYFDRIFEVLESKKDSINNLPDRIKCEVFISNFRMLIIKVEDGSKTIYDFGGKNVIKELELNNLIRPKKTYFRIEEAPAVRPGEDLMLYAESKDSEHNLDRENKIIDEVRSLSYLLTDEETKIVVSNSDVEDNSDEDCRFVVEIVSKRHDGLNWVDRRKYQTVNNSRFILSKRDEFVEYVDRIIGIFEKFSVAAGCSINLCLNGGYFHILSITTNVRYRDEDTGEVAFLSHIYDYEDKSHEDAEDWVDKLEKRLFKSKREV